MDGDRIAVLGHSMGAGAVLDFATLDARPKAVIPLSGGWVANDGVVPAHTLFLVASGDPDVIHDAQDDLAADLRAAGGDVVQKEISGVDHTTILRRDETVAAVTAFLDPILGVERAAGDKPGMDDPRLKTAALYLLVALALIAMFGAVVGRVAPAGPGRDQAGPGWSGFALVTGALVLTMPVLTQGRWDLLPLGAGQPIVMHLALDGGRALGLPRRRAARGADGAGGPLARRRPPVAVPAHGGLDRPGRGRRRGGAAAAPRPRLPPHGAHAAAGGLLGGDGGPGAPVLRRLPRPRPPRQRLGVGGDGRPRTAPAPGRAVRGGARRALPFVLLLVLPLLILQYVLLELFAATSYLGSRNTTVIAIVDAVVVGWLAVTFTPVG